MKIAQQAAPFIVFACLALPLHAQDQEQAESQREEEPIQQPIQQSISITKDGSLPLDLLPGKKVFVAFKNSGKITEVLAERVTRLGGQVVQSEEDADVVLEGEGVFLAARQYGNRRAHADAGEMFEKVGRIKTRGRSLDIVLTPGGSALSAVDATLLASAIYSVAKATGFRDWFNTLVSGDPDGFCFSGCEYKQRAAIGLKMRNREEGSMGTVSTTAIAENRKLMPLPLIDAALGAMLEEFADRSAD